MLSSPVQWVKISSITTAEARIQSLVWELPYIKGVAMNFKEKNYLYDITPVLKSQPMLGIKDCTLTPCTKINSKWLIDLNIRHDTIKLLEEKRGKTFSDISGTNVFLGQSPKAIAIKTKINKCNLIILTSFCTAEEIFKKNEKTTYRMGENICK